MRSSYRLKAPQLTRVLGRTLAAFLLAACNPHPGSREGGSPAVPYWQPALAMMPLDRPAATGDGEALREMTAAAQAGDPVAMDDLGRELLVGAGRTPSAADWANLDQAQMWWNKAAAMGDASAMILLGHMYAEGWGVPPDRERAASWLKQAADQGRRDARLDLARLYLGEWSYDSDMPQAISWLERFADQSQDESAMIQLGLIYDAGLNVRPDPRKAAQWYQRALDQRAHDENGDSSPELAIASNNLGLLYEQGRGVPRDADRARSLLAQADAANPLPPGPRMRLGLWPFQVDLSYVDPVSRTTYSVDRDGRHLIATASNGRILWRRDPFVDAKLHANRISFPRIVMIGPPRSEVAPGAGGHAGLEVDYNSAQVVLIDPTRGAITVPGQS